MARVQEELSLEAGSDLEIKDHMGYSKGSMQGHVLSHMSRFNHLESGLMERRGCQRPGEAEGQLFNKAGEGGLDWRVQRKESGPALKAQHL